MVNNPSNSKKQNDSEKGNFQLKTIHETKPSVIKQSLKNAFFGPSFFKYTSKFNEFSLSTDTSINIETILRDQKGDPVLMIALKRINENSRPADKNTYNNFLSISNGTMWFISKTAY